ncbi:MAG TPA: mismatch-specific DNA-glycosylase [Nitrospira sp.]|nr:mismatch-specific DNA-glycosylase [Nitrospira sp.]
MRTRELPDYLAPRLRVLFVGINPGLRSAMLGHHFAGRSNRFWKLLYDSRLVDEPLTYLDDWRLPEWHLGLTNIIGRASAGIDDLRPSEYQQGRRALEQKVVRYRPKILAFLGVTIFRRLFPDASPPSRVPALGATSASLARVPIYLLPNPSGRNAHYPYRRMLAAFRGLHELAT